MNTYKTYVQIDSSGRVVLEGLPFREGALVEVLVVDQSHQPSERTESWQALMRHVQGLPQSQTISDEEIAAEIERHRKVDHSQ
jgi:hypothetical protein